jgi:hypothetical protein
MPIGISGGAIRNKKGTLIVEDKIKKIVQTYGNLYFLTENGVLSGVGLNNSVQIRGSTIKLANAAYAYVYDYKGTTITGKLYAKANYVEEWGLRFLYNPSILETPNLNYVYFKTALGHFDNLDFDAGYTHTTNTTYQSSLFKNFSFSVKKNGELWGWGYNANLELGIASDTGYTLKLPNYGVIPDSWEWGTTSHPIERYLLNSLHKSLEGKTVFSQKKLNNFTNWTSVVANNIGENYKHILLNSIGEIYTFGGNLNAPVKMGSKSDWKYISYDYAINNNNELYRLRDVSTYDYTGLTKIGIDEWKTVDKHGDYAIKTDNTLWSISGTPYQVDSNMDYENVFYGTPVRTTDPYDIKITTNQYFLSSDTDTINSLSVIKPERTVVNLREYDPNTGFIGVSANILHGNVKTYESRTYNTTNFNLKLPSVVKY